MKQGAPIEYVDLRFAGRVVVQQATPPEEEKAEANPEAGKPEAGKNEKKRGMKAVAQREKASEIRKPAGKAKKESPRAASKSTPKPVEAKGKKHAKTG